MERALRNSTNKQHTKIQNTALTKHASACCLLVELRSAFAPPLTHEELHGIVIRTIRDTKWDTDAKIECEIFVATFFVN